MRKCENCKKSTFDSAKFCHHCGAKMEKFIVFDPEIFGENKNSDEESKKEETAIEEQVDSTVSATNEAGTEEVLVLFPLGSTGETTPEEEKKETEASRPPIEDLPIKVKKPKYDIEFEIVDDLPFESNIDYEKREIPEIEIEFEDDKEEETEFEDNENVLPSKDKNESSIDLKETPNEKEEKSTTDQTETSDPNDIFGNHPNQDIEEELFQKFADVFEQQIKTEQNPALYNQYVDRFEMSELKIVFENRVKQLAEQVAKIRTTDEGIFKKEEDIIDRAFSEIIDYFLITYAQDLNTTPLPESILKYQHISVDQSNIGEMIVDYLDMENEAIRWHTDFIKMPAKSLKNASKIFLFPDRKETIFGIADLTILGNGKEGFAFTSNAVYWKMQFESPQRVYFKNLKTVEIEKDWLLINGIFFTATPSLNIKIMKLLKKLMFHF